MIRQTWSKIARIASTSNILSTSCITQAKRSSPIPVSIFLLASSRYVPSACLSNWVNTLFHTSINRSHSQPTLQSGSPQPLSAPLSKYISEQGPQGPVPCSQKLSSLPIRKILSGDSPTSLFQMSKASSSSS